MTLFMDFLLCCGPLSGCQLLGAEIMSVLSLLSPWILALSLAQSRTSLNEWTDEWMNGQAGFQSLMCMGTGDSPYISGTTFRSWDVVGKRGEGLAEVKKSLSGLIIHFCVESKSQHYMPWHRNVMSSAWLFPLSMRKKESLFWRYQWLQPPVQDWFTT